RARARTREELFSSMAALPAALAAFVGAPARSAPPRPAKAPAVTRPATPSDAVGLFAEMAGEPAARSPQSWWVRAGAVALPLLLGLAVGFILLRTRPKGSATDFEQGKLQALKQADWDRALPLLANGSDAVWKAAAQWELARPGSATARTAAGNAWWRAAEAETGTARA